MSYRPSLAKPGDFQQRLGRKALRFDAVPKERTAFDAWLIALIATNAVCLAIDTREAKRASSLANAGPAGLVTVESERSKSGRPTHGTRRTDPREQFVPVAERLMLRDGHTAGRGELKSTGAAFSATCQEPAKQDVVVEHLAEQPVRAH